MTAIYRLFSFLILAGFVVGCSSCGKDSVGPTDKTRPTVVSTVPVMDDSLVSLNTTVSATFSEPMNPATVAAGVITLDPATTGSTSYSGVTVTFTPDNCMCTEMCDTCTLPESNPLEFKLVRTSDLSDCPVVDDVDWPRDPNR